MKLKDLKGFPKEKEYTRIILKKPLKIIARNPFGVEGYNQARSKIGEIELVVDVKEAENILRIRYISEIYDETPQYLSDPDIEELAQSIAGNIKDIIKVKK